MKTQNLKFLLVFLIGGLLFTSCDPDPTGGTHLGANLTLEEEDGFVTEAAEGPVSGVFHVKLTATKGDTSLYSLTIFEGTEKLALDRITINGVAASGNPKLLLGDDANGFTFDIGIKAQSEVSLVNYTFEVADDNGEVSKKSVDITTVEVQDPLILEYIGSASRVVDGGTLTTAKIKATTGSNQLKEIAVYLDGNLIDPPTDLSFAGVDFTSNPNPISADYLDGFEENIGFRVPSEVGTYVYRIEVSDIGSTTESQEITFEIVVVPTGTPVTLLEGVLYNREGPVGYGGLDLDNGATTGSSDGNAEIKDLGGFPWRQQIAGVDGAVLQYVIPGENGLGESFSFAGVTFKEDLAAITGNGSAFTESNPLVVGDMILVSDNGLNYLIVVKEVNVTSNDNNDNYVFDVKF